MKTKFEYLLATLIILDCNTIFSRSDLIKMPIWFLFIISFSLYNLVFNLKKTQKSKIKNISIEIMLYIIIILISIISTGFINNNTIKVLFILFPMLYCFTKLNYQSRFNIIKKIPKIMLCLCVLSLIIWLIGPILKILKPSSSIMLDWGSKRKIDTFLYVHYITQTTHVLGNLIVRNTGIFVEAPMFSFMISVSLLTDLYILKECKVKTIIIYLITTISTFSTTGFLVFAAAMLIYMLYTNPSILKKINKIYRYAIIIVIISLSIFISIKKFNSSSYSTRIDDYKASVITFAKNPLFGCGFGNEESIRQNMGDFRTNNLGLSNSVFVLLAQMGIFIFIPLIFSITKKIKQFLKSKNYDSLIYLLMMVLLLSVTICIYQIIFVYMIVLLVINKINNREKLQEEI